ncbi:MAG: flavodoxin family protein [Lachnospiraceae bacterium]|nr:flavodoxin family protein [Lachnospiraceae bacterium]
MEKKRVVGLVAGRHNGNSEILVKEALMACEEAGLDCILINLFDYNIIPCSGCEGCTMQMGAIATGQQKEYKGCIYKDKDDMDKIINTIQTSDGIIIGCPTYDLGPSALYLLYAHRALAYEVSFRLEIGDLKKNPNLVSGLIAVGGSCHDWQSLALEVLGASMFTQSIQVVDQMMAIRNGRPGNVLLRDEQIAKAREIGQHVAEAIETPVEERHWLGDPDFGVCPVCHSSLVYPGDPHWDGIEFPFECAVCGCGGDLVKGDDGKYKFVIDPEHGHDRDRNINECRALHLDEIIQTRIEFFGQQELVKEKYKKYKEKQFPSI